MTFELNFEYQEVPFRADVTVSGKDFLVNLVSPVHYETAPTMVLTRHDDGSMKYDTGVFDENGFMPAIESALKQYLQTHDV